MYYGTEIRSASGRHIREIGRKSPEVLEAERLLQTAKLLLTIEQRIQPGTGKVETLTPITPFSDYRSSQLPDRVIRVITHPDQSKEKQIVDIFHLDYSEDLGRHTAKIDWANAETLSEKTAVNDVHALMDLLRSFLPNRTG